MKKPSFRSISLFFILVLFGIGIVFYLSDKYYPSNNDKNFRSITENPLPDKEGEQVIEVQEYITADTIFIWQSMDVSSNTTTELQIPVPEMYIGLKREGFLEKIEDLKKNPPLTELEKGFSSIEVLEFSPQKIRLRANYQKEEFDDRFCLMVKEHYVVIYYSDKETLYMNTGILLETLPDDLQLKIISGYELEGEQQLYNFLESYTS